jgi:hypothetical protein
VFVLFRLLEFDCMALNLLNFNVIKIKILNFEVIILSLLFYRRTSISGTKNSADNLPAYTFFPAKVVK